MWKGGKWVASDPQLDLDMGTTDKDGESRALSHLRCDEATEMLGV